MLQKKVKKRATLLIALTLISLLAIFFILMGLNKNILYFKSPTDIKTNEDINFNKKIRVGGMVKKNSLVIEEKEIKFIITDFQNELQISFSGTVPNLFSEEKGVVAEGKLQDKSFFIANKILAKHDENYMPPELKNLMKNNVKYSWKFYIIFMCDFKFKHYLLCKSEPKNARGQDK